MSAFGPKKLISNGDDSPGGRVEQRVGVIDGEDLASGVVADDGHAGELDGLLACVRDLAAEPAGNPLQLAVVNESV